MIQLIDSSKSNIGISVMMLLPSPTWARIIKDLLIYLREIEQNLDVVTEFFYGTKTHYLCFLAVKRAAFLNPGILKPLSCHSPQTSESSWLCAETSEIRVFSHSNDKKTNSFFHHDSHEFPGPVCMHLPFVGFACQSYISMTSCVHLFLFFPQWPAKFMFCLHSYNTLNCPLG